MILAAGTSGMILIELGALLLGLAIVARLADRVGLSPIPLYLAVGIAVGEDGIYDLGVSDEFISTGAAIGVVLLLFLLGLEYQASELRSALRLHAPAGAVDLGLNALPGAVLALLLGWTPLEAALLGGITYISSSGIVAKLLDDLGRTGNRETPSIVSILVIEDLVMAFYLPLVAGLLTGGTVLATTGSVGLALVVVIAILVGAVRLGPHLSRAVFSPSPEVLLLSVLGLTLLVSGLAEEASVSSAVGAFLVGLALSGPTAELAQPLLTPLRDLFAAAFFVFFGLSIDLAQVPEVIVPAALLAVVGAVTKTATGWLTARRAGIGRPGRWRAGFTLIARGEFSIVIAELGRAGGVDDRLPVLAATFVLILAVVGPVAARLVEPMLAAVDRR